MCTFLCTHVKILLKIVLERRYIILTIKATTARDLRKNFKQIANDVSDYNDIVFITRPENKNVVLLSEKEFNSWQETNYLLSTKANKEALQRGLSSKHSNKILSPEEWDNLVQTND